jgi:hypothetical protein
VAGDDFKRIKFGFADAHTEGAEAPELLRDGFLDEGLIDMALSDRKFLFLGYKGSGKTAIGERARLLAETDHSRFIKVATLDEFPYSDFKSAAGTAEPQPRYPIVWKWLLLVALFELFESDEGGKERAPVTYHSSAQGLKHLGLIPTPELNSLVVQSSKKSFKLELPKVLGLGYEKMLASQDLSLSQAATALSDSACAFPTSSRHVLFLDGLDEILGQRDLQFQALAALITAASRLNNTFREKRKPFKVVILCRTDIYDRLPGANLNKIRQDQAESLHWYDDASQLNETRLVRLVNLRASRSLNRSVNVFSEFLPGRVSGQDPRKLILDHTRHTPRDLIRLFGHLQQRSNGGAISAAQVHAALRSYSIEYFLPEIRNEMHGYMQHDEIQKAEQVLREHGSQYFTHKELADAQARLGENESLDLKEMTNVLFDSSAIGFIEKRGRRTLRTVKYKNPHTQIAPGKMMWLHPAACRALSIQPGKP